MIAPEAAKFHFSLTRGGPMYGLFCRIGSPTKRSSPLTKASLVFVAATWLPMVTIGALEWVRTKTLDPILLDVVVHTRLLLAIPLFFCAEGLLDQRCTRAIDEIVEFRYTSRLDVVPKLARHVQTMRDAVIPELLLLVIALVRGQALLWSSTPGTAARVWYFSVGLPLFLFLFLRWLYRWGLWASLLFGLSKSELTPAAAHPDRTGGLSCLAEPIDGFALFVLANSTFLAAGWGKRMLGEGVAMQTFTPAFAVFVLASAAIGVGPLLVFTRSLLRARLDGIQEYRGLALSYVRLFHRRWHAEKVDESLLGSADISSLTDLQSTYRNVEQMRVVAFGKRAPAVILVAAIIPVLPLVTIEVPIGELFAKLAHVMLGGLAR